MDTETALKLATCIGTWLTNAVIVFTAWCMWRCEQRRK